MDGNLTWQLKRHGERARSSCFARPQLQVIVKQMLDEAQEAVQARLRAFSRRFQAILRYHRLHRGL